MSSKTEPARHLPSGLLMLKKIVEGTSEHTGEMFFRQLVRNLAESLDAHGVWITKYLKDKNRLRALAFWLDDQYVDEYEYDVPGTPCEPVLENKGICHVPERVIELYPDDPDLPPLGAVSYMGLSLRDENDNILGHLALLDNKPMEEIPEAFAIFRIFAARAAAEMRRLRYENILIENETRLNRLVNGTRDALIEIDEQLSVSQANQAALLNFACKEEKFIGQPISKYFDGQSIRQIADCINHLHQAGQHSQSFSFPGQLVCIKSDRKMFRAEATISKYHSEGLEFHALFLRNIEDSLNTQEELKQLSAEAVMLREKVSDHNFENIIGRSPEILKALEAVEQVAPTDTSVLIRGETGTGKELFAQAIHKASKRKHKPIVMLNCATLPSELVESELFGHVKGAFTGATNAREGRFSLADGGTIFLDEIGELPLHLQAKLLRVLQEGEFEPIGSSKTSKVDVRVVAATNRNLEEEVAKGTFRQDLFYRLNVFPIEIPPLRARSDDIIMLAEAFLEKFSKRAAKVMGTLDAVSRQRLLAYPWPGNVRELQNIIERCIIISQDGKINLSQLLPASETSQPLVNTTEEKVFTETEMNNFEKQNIIKALDLCNWKISGDDGAAAMLQIPSTTLSSRISKLGIKRGS
ncbi:MAG: sigma 54-interacting transcriptional regulator [Bacteroidales bacterium]|nr:sigma 54-interacting transcriptional regulator [Bacteroidales bacterium]